MFLASPLLSGGIGTMLKDLGRPCYTVVEEDNSCVDYFPSSSTELLYRVQCVDVNADGSKACQANSPNKKMAKRRQRRHR